MPYESEGTYGKKLKDEGVDVSVHFIEVLRAYLDQVGNLQSEIVYIEIAKVY